MPTPPFVQPYLFFGGKCAEALDFYTRHLGAQVVMTMKFGQNPEPCADGQLPPGWDDKIMHAGFTIGSSFLMGSDGMEECGAKSSGKHCMSLTMPDEAEARRAFDALAEGGHVFMPLGKTFWSPCFGMVTDAFGISWMITVPEAHA